MQPAGAGRWPWIICILLALAVAVVFGRTVRFEFVNFDDNMYVYKNPLVAGGLTAAGVLAAFTRFHAHYWSPLTWISYLVDHQICGLQPWGYHLDNVVLHAATAILLFLVLRRMTGRQWPGALVAALFAVHPLHVESVAWVTERKDVLSGLFFMLTVAAYLGYVRRPFSVVRYMVLVLCFVCGLLSKPTLVTVPFVLLLLDYWPLRRWDPLGGSRASAAGPAVPAFPRRVLVEKIPLLMLAAVCCVMTMLSQAKAVIPLEQLPWPTRAANVLVAYSVYLGQSFWPSGLAVFYPYPSTGQPIWAVIGSLLLLAGVSVAAVVLRRSLPFLLIGWLWYLGMLVPVIGLVQVGGQAMADRYMYLPQIGLTVLLVWSARDFCAGRPRRLWAAGAGAVLLVVLLGAVAWRQAGYWRTSETLWRRALACTSRNYIAHNNLGNVLAGRGQPDAAIAEYRLALEIKPNYFEAHNNLGTAMADLGRVDEAIAEYRQALNINPNYVDAHFNLGMALASRGQAAEAIVHYRQVLEIQPDDIPARGNLGVALASLGRVAEAIAEYQQVLNIKPNEAMAQINLAWIYATNPDPKVRDGVQAVALAQRAVALSLNNPGGLDTLAAAYAESGRFADAVQTERQARDLATQQKQPALAKAIQARLRLYEAGKPYREMPSAPPVRPDPR